jgi:condensin complex subunit 3
MVTPEKAFLARVCVERCITINDKAKLERFLPRDPLAPHLPNPKCLQQVSRRPEAVSQGRVLYALDADERDVDERPDEFLLDAEFVIAEIGWQKIFQLVRDMMRQERLVASCLDVVTNRDLIRVVVEVVHELSDEREEQDEECEGEKEGEEGGEVDACPWAVKAPKVPKP